MVCNHCRWFQLAFVFIVLFAVVLWFREEIYTVSKGDHVSHSGHRCNLNAAPYCRIDRVITCYADVQKHPILAGIESLQIHKYLGSQWVFGSEKDEDDADGADSIAAAIEELTAANATVTKSIVEAVVNATATVVKRANVTVGNYVKP